MELVSDSVDLTPVEHRGHLWLKRDDLFTVAGAIGGKARTCWALAQGAKGLVTASNRHSPQAIIVSAIAHHLGIPARIHLPTGETTPEMQMAEAAGAVFIRHRNGRNSVIVARARTDAVEQGYKEIPFGMNSLQAIEGTANQVRNLPKRKQINRIVMPVGSGMSLSGVLTGLQRHRPDLNDVPVLGIQVGAARTKVLNRAAPFGWQGRCTLLFSGVDYSVPVDARIDGILIDPFYEAKCIPFLKDNDVFWIVGIRPQPPVVRTRLIGGA